MRGVVQTSLAGAGTLRATDVCAAVPRNSRALQTVTEPAPPGHIPNPPAPARSGVRNGPSAQRANAASAVSHAVHQMRAAEGHGALRSGGWQSRGCESSCRRDAPSALRRARARRREIRVAARKREPGASTIVIASLPKGEEPTSTRRAPAWAGSFAGAPLAVEDARYWLSGGAVVSLSPSPTSRLLPILTSTNADQGVEHFRDARRSRGQSQDASDCVDSPI
jgi:hypothetical protein